MIDVYSSSSKQNLASRKQKTSNEEKVRDRQTRQTRLKGGPQECSDETRITRGTVFVHQPRWSIGRRMYVRKKEEQRRDTHHIVID